MLWTFSSLENYSILNPYLDENEIFIALESSDCALLPNDLHLNQNHSKYRLVLTPPTCIIIRQSCSVFISNQGK